MMIISAILTNSEKKIMKAQMIKKLEILTREATKNTSNALLKLTNKKIAIKIAHIKVEDIRENFPEISPESTISGTYLSVTGDIHGASVIIFPEKVVLDLCGLLFSRSKSDFLEQKGFSRLDKSILEKISNILCENFLAVFAKALKVKFIDSSPKFTFDVFGSVADNLKSEFVRRFNRRLVLEVQLDFEHASTKGPIMIVFGFEETEIILKALEEND